MYCDAIRLCPERLIRLKSQGRENFAETFCIDVPDSDDRVRMLATGD